MGFVVAGGAQVIGGLIGAGAAKKAGEQQAAAIQNAVDFQKQVYGQGQQNLQPYIGAGQSALSTLLGFYGLPGGNAFGATAGFQQFTNTPFYQFPLQQSQLALNRQLASSGLIGSGAALRDATQLAQGYASQGLSQYVGGIGGIAGAGQNAAGTLLGAGNTAAGTLLQGYQGIGNAQAAGTIGQANQYNNALGGLPLALGYGGTGYGGVGGYGGSSYGPGGIIGSAVNSWFTPSAGAGNPAATTPGFDPWAGNTLPR